MFYPNFFTASGGLRGILWRFSKIFGFLNSVFHKAKQLRFLQISKSGAQSSFRASEARPGIQEFQVILDSGWSLPS